MKAEELKLLGFKKVIMDDDYWFEFRTGKHLFLTNDTSKNNRRDYWYIGYENDKEKNMDIYWFNEKLKEPNQFKSVFQILTGREYKLPIQKKHKT